MSKKYDYAVVIGRFQPFHQIHLQIIEHALAIAENAIIVLGSARSAPDIKNPFTPAMREAMIRPCFGAETQSRLHFGAVRDYPYNDNIWTAEVQNIIAQIVEDTAQGNEDNAEVALVGFFKDRSSYYLNLFPQWNFEEFYRSPEHLKQPKTLSATQIRESFFETKNEEWREFVPPSVEKFLDQYRQTPFFEELQKEFEYIRKYRADTRFVGVPYDPIFVTTDAVVVQSGHVLVIRRGHQPGKGLLALPGGFLQKGLTVEESAIKELKEETAIKSPVSVLRGSIKNSHVFDYPERSQRGRTITHGFFIELEADLKNGLPKVKGGDDAAKAFWLPLSALGEKEEEFFEDHLHIIKHFLGM